MSVSYAGRSLTTLQQDPASKRQRAGPSSQREAERVPDGVMAHWRRCWPADRGGAGQQQRRHGAWQALALRPSAI